MASVSVSHLIIFIASLVVAAGVAGTLTTGVERVSSSIEDGSLDTSQQIRTDVEIVSDPQASYSDPLTIYVRNTGSQNIPIDPGSVDVIFNGEFVSNSDISIQDANNPSNTVWRTGDVVNITISNSNIQTGEDNRLFLTVNGDREEFEFQG